MLKIGFLCLLDPTDRRNFSGTLFYMLRSLEQAPNVEVSVLGEAYFDRSKKNNLIKKVFNAAARRIKRLQSFKKKLDDKQLINTVLHDLSASNYDAIVAPVASRLIAKLPENTPPVLFITDATPAFVEKFYGWEVSDEAYKNEVLTLKKSSLIIYSSDFMQALAEQDYAQQLNLSKKSLMTIPFGLNLDDAPAQVIKKSISNQTINLLFVARFWERKGGTIALDCLIALTERGLNAHLTIVGCSPEIDAQIQQYVTVIPFLNKNNPEEQQKYFDLLSDAHFFILPTRADCTPMVIAEANAFSTPVLVTNVGGIGTLVKDGENGHLFSLEDKGKDYADKVSALIEQSRAYENLSNMSFEKYQTLLNWDAWAQTITNQLEAQLTAP